MSPEIQYLVQQRRQALQEIGRLPYDVADPRHVSADDAWGLALSGGGIRSATFCFGLLHALASNGLLARFDLMSTVSGGGYIGGMLGRLFSRAESPRDAAAMNDALASGNDRWFAWWLRANGRYLVPQGMKDRFFALAVYIRNLLGIHLELGLVGLVLGTLLASFDLVAWKSVAILANGQWDLFVRLRDWIIWIPSVYLLLPILLALALLWCWAFWVVAWRIERPAAVPPTVAVVFVAGASLVGYLWLKAPQLSVTLLAILMLWILAVGTADVIARGSREMGGSQVRQDQARNVLTKNLSTTLRIAAWLALIGVIDRAAWWLAFEHASWVDTGYALAIAAAVARVLLSPSSGLREKAGNSKMLLVALGIVGRLLTFLLFVWWVAVVHAAASGRIFDKGVDFGAALIPLAVIFAVALLYMLLTGTDTRFLNLSSLHGFYRARLVRSYLGATNAARFRPPPAPSVGAMEKMPRSPEDVRVMHVDDVDPGDDVSMKDYAPHRYGGPVHLINSCLNETTDPRGGLFNRDRRGRMLTVGPQGMMRVGQSAWQLAGSTRADMLTLGSWMAISGAAVSPGLGSMTRGGISSLAMFGGARLGYWWDSLGASHGGGPRRWPLSKIAGVLRETFGIFGGPETRDWYLTDGGHFENTGAYTLLAEGARVVFVADCGADPSYRFGDIENLVRKARIDLQIDIEFLKPSGMHPPGDPLSNFGSLNDLASDTSQACFALARIDYSAAHPGSRPGLLILIKPNLCGGLPVDLFNFKAENPEFPQQGTADQFFDEAQWESYFQLGKALGQRFQPGWMSELLERADLWFVRDDGSPIGNGGSDGPKPPAAAAAGGATPPPSRTPARLIAASTLGLGAVSAAGVALWQALDAVKVSHEQQVKEERAALKELTDLWAKMTNDPATRLANANALAATLARVSDTLCPGGDAGWFNRSPLAVDLLADTIKACAPGSGETAPRACEWLVRASDQHAEGARSTCLRVGRTIGDQQFDEQGCTYYWGYDYSAHAVARCAHPKILALRSSDKQSPAVAAAGPATAASGATGASTSLAEDEARTCLGKSLLPTIYGRNDLEGLRTRMTIWRGKGVTVEEPRDLLALAKESGRSSPPPVEVTSLRYRSATGLLCAQALANMVGARGWRIEPAAEARNASSDALELWVAPGSLSGRDTQEPARPTGSPTPSASSPTQRDPAPRPGPAASNPPPAAPAASRAGPAASSPSGPAQIPPRQEPTAPAPSPQEPVVPRPYPAASAACQTTIVVQGCGCANVTTTPAPPPQGQRRPATRPASKPRAQECTVSPSTPASAGTS